MHTYPAKSVYVFLQKIYTGNCERIENILHLLWCLFESLPNKYLGTVNSTVAQETAFMTEVSCFFGETHPEIEKTVEHGV